MADDASLSVAVVEDDRGTREGLAALIGGTPGFVASARSAPSRKRLKGLAAAVPDVLLLDIHLPGVAGSEGVRLLRERYPRTQVLMLTVFAEEERVFESLCNGACGYLLKKTPPARLLEAIARSARRRFADVAGHRAQGRGRPAEHRSRRKAGTGAHAA